jgi:hypothetical protein
VSEESQGDLESIVRKKSIMYVCARSCVCPCTSSSWPPFYQQIIQPLSYYPMSQCRPSQTTGKSDQTRNRDAALHATPKPPFEHHHSPSSPGPESDLHLLQPLPKSQRSCSRPALPLSLQRLDRPHPSHKCSSSLRHLLLSHFRHSQSRQLPPASPRALRAHQVPLGRQEFD